MSSTRWIWRWARRQLHLIAVHILFEPLSVQLCHFLTPAIDRTIWTLLALPVLSVLPTLVRQHNRTPPTALLQWRGNRWQHLMR